MKKVILESIAIENWKGQNTEVAFKGEKTTITGRNGCGKSTIFKSFVWLLTGRTDAFTGKNNELYDNTKPITADTPPAMVTADLSIDGKRHALGRSAKPKYKRPKGSTDLVRESSDEYKYWVDCMEYTATDYSSWVSHNIADTDMLACCLDGAFFAELAENDRQKASETLIALLASNTDYEIGKCEDGSTPEEKRKELKAKARKLETETKTLPSQIMSCEKMLSAFCEHGHDEEESVCPTCGRAIKRKKEKESVKSFDAVKKEAQEQIDGMRSRMKQAGIELAETEKELVLVEQYAQKCANTLSDKVNKSLVFSKLQMYEVQKNGETKPSCTIMSIDGVKYSTLNFSARLVVNVEISRFFCRLLGVNMPCFVDECSVFDSKHLPVIDRTQMIYMRCSDDQKLVVL